MAPGMSILLPYMLLAGGGLVVLCAGIAGRRGQGVYSGAGLAAVAAAGVFGAIVSPSEPNFGGMIDASGFSRYFFLLVCVIAAFVLLLSARNARLKAVVGDEYYALVLFASLGMALVASALNWIVFFLGLEMLSISFYVLIGAPRTDPNANEAALKYFVMGSVASGFLLFGLALLFAATGTLDIVKSLGPSIGSHNAGLALLALGLAASGILFKVSIVPFHLWTPDVYQGAPAPVTAFLSTGSKVALFAALLRFCLEMTGDLFAYALPGLWGLAAATMIVGNVTALAQTSLKRLLAYSSIAQMGYVLMALLTVKESGAQAVVFYLSVYALMDIGAFGAVALLSPQSSELDEIGRYRGLGYSRPWTCALLAVCLLSLAGLPPTAGFIGKVLIFKTVLQSGYTVLAVIGIVTAIVSVYFYLNVVVALFMRPAEGLVPTASPGRFGAALSACIAALVVILGIVPSPLLSLIEEILHALRA